MEKRIKTYETYIQEKIKKGVNQDLIDYHRETLQNFQHERLVHELIMLFFVFVTFIVTGAFFWFLADFTWGKWVDYLPAALVVILLWILSIAYVKHYYFLENHVQKLYDVSKELFEKKK